MEQDQEALQRVREDRLLLDRCDAWLFGEIQPYVGRRVLEFGCGLGNLARLLQNRECYLGIDSSPESVAALQAEYGDHPNMTIMCLDVTDPAVLELRDHRFDTVVSLNVLEHIAEDVLALHNSGQVLQPGGRVISIVPAHSWLFGTIDRAIGHLRRYTKASMRGKLAEAGLRPTMQKYVNALGALGWFVNSRILRKRTPSRAQLKAFNRLVPALIKLEQAIRFPLGISLVTVGEPEGSGA